MDTVPVPLPTLLSWALVAFTIELDNEFEHRMPKQTASLVMWYNAMQFIGDEGVRVTALSQLARATTTLHGLTRWGYITVAPESPNAASKHSKSRWLIRATPAGRLAREVWRTLPIETEEHWKERFGHAEIARLRDTLAMLLRSTDMPLPDGSPTLGAGLFVQEPITPEPAWAQALQEKETPPALPVLLSRALLSFALEFERTAFTSLAVSANILRVLTEAGLWVSDLPSLTGVSKQAIQIMLGILQKGGLAAAETPEGSRTKMVRLTPMGQEAQRAYRDRLCVVEDHWAARFGDENIRALRQSLERMIGPSLPQSPLFAGMEPYPDGWRARVPRPDVLPHFPVVLLHRGGYPDGS